MTLNAVCVIILGNRDARVPAGEARIAVLEEGKMEQDAKNEYDEGDASRKISLDFWDRVYAILKERRLTLKWLSETTGIPRTTISSAHGSGMGLRIKTAIAISGALGVSLDYLLSGTVSPQEKAPDIPQKELFKRAEEATRDAGTAARVASLMPFLNAVQSDSVWRHALSYMGLSPDEEKSDD